MEEVALFFIKTWKFNRIFIDKGIGKSIIQGSNQGVKVLGRFWEAWVIGNVSGILDFVLLVHLKILFVYPQKMS